jgi:hypothetical protein
MKYFKKILPITFVFLICITIIPSFTFADSSQPDCSSVASGAKNIGQLFTLAICTLDNTVIPFLVGIGLVIFLAGVVKFVGAGDNEEKRQGGRDMMIFGLIALFIMVSVWGFVNLLSNSIFGKNVEIQSLPAKSTTIFK